MEGEKDPQDLDTKFGIVEYAVFGIVLALPAAIGVFHGCFGAKQKTTEEFLMANRQLSALPVALSLICSFISPITLLGNPAEIYLYGTQIVLMLFAFIPITISVIYFYIPVYFNLRTNSAFQYLQMRFSKATSVFVSLLAILYLTVFMSIMVFGPSLALQQVTGIDVRLTTAAIFGVSIFYSALGGLKAVVWNDTLQVVVMFVSLTAIAVKGCVDEGGIGVVWQRAQNTSRIEFLNVDPDPRTRHTLWTAVIGGYFYWLPMYAATQPRIQRYLALPSLKVVRQAQILNLLGNLVFSVLCMLVGLVVYARFHDCDPLAKKVITNSDQLLPLLAMQTSSNMPGLAGVFVAGLTSSSLSYVSGALSGLASIVTYDYVRKFSPNMEEKKLVTLCKIVTIGFGFLSFGLVFLVERMGNILPVTASIIGAIVGPTLGIFALGMFFPWANAKGALTGILTAVILMMSFAIGGFVAKNKNLLPDQRLHLSTECPAIPPAFLGNSSLSLSNTASDDWKDQEYSPIIQLLSISYLWHPMIGSCATVFLGLLFSFIYSMCHKTEKIQSEFLSPPMYALWKMIFPKSIKRFVMPPQIERSYYQEDSMELQRMLKT